jgi:hypothetical protein
LRGTSLGTSHHSTGLRNGGKRWGLRLFLRERLKERLFEAQQIGNLAVEMMKARVSRKRRGKRRSWRAARICVVGLLVLWGAPGCREAGVLPDGLVEVGSVRSEEYAAQILYPEMGIPLELVSPREGDPALLGPQEDELSVIFYSHTPVSWSETVVFAKETDSLF